MVTLQNPFPLDNLNDYDNTYRKYLQIFKHVVWGNIAPLPKTPDSEQVHNWLLKISTGVNWYGIRSIDQLLNTWSLLESTEDTPVFPTFNRIYIQVKALCGALGIDTIAIRHLQAKSMIYLYPEAKEGQSLAKHDVLLESTLTIDELNAVLDDNPWLLIAMSFAHLNTAEIYDMFVGPTREQP